MSRQFLLNGWLDWAEILWVCSLGYHILPYVLIFCVTAPKRLCRLNSNLLTTIPYKPLNELSWNFVSMFLRITYCALITKFCVTAPKRLRRDWTQILKTHLLQDHSTDWTEILWVWFLGYWVVPYLLSFCVTTPKRPRQLNSNLEDTTPSKPLNKLSWNFVGMIFRIFSCALST